MHGDTSQSIFKVILGFVMYELPYILTLNAGSSSLKAELFAIPSRELRHIFIIEDIGLSSARCTITENNEAHSESLTSVEHDEALRLLISFMRKHYSQEPLVITHRIVHGGTHFTEPSRMSSYSLDTLRTLIPLAPNHLPIQISYLEQLLNTYSRTTHVGCFDTAFHAHMPQLAQLTTFPRSYRDAGLRRYGFHGLSYEYIVKTLRNRDALPEKLICAHLGSGASVCAIRDGASIETSMGMTPASGIMMSTRTGDIDPGIVRFIESVHPLTPLEFDSLVNKESGLKGVSGSTGDMRTLLEMQSTDEHAREAVDLFCYTVKKCIGAYAALLNGVDMIVFTGGVGERSDYIRRTICCDLDYLGIEIAEDIPANHTLMSTPASRVRIEVIHTDESMVMYEHALRFLAL